MINISRFLKKANAMFNKVNKLHKTTPHIFTETEASEPKQNKRNSGVHITNRMAI